MKNAMKLIGLIALTAIITFTTACKNDDDADNKDKIVVEVTSGQLIITGIPVTYNGNYIFASGYTHSVQLFALADVKPLGSEDLTLTLGKISGGSATLKVWQRTETGLAGYNGNDIDVEFMLSVLKNSTYKYSDDPDSDMLASSDEVAVTFIAGKATVDVSSVGWATPTP